MKIKIFVKKDVAKKIFSKAKLTGRGVQIDIDYDYVQGRVTHEDKKTGEITVDFGELGKRILQKDNVVSDDVISVLDTDTSF